MKDVAFAALAVSSLGFAADLVAQGNMPLTTLTPVAVASTAPGTAPVIVGVPANWSVVPLDLTTVPTYLEAASLFANASGSGPGATARVDTNILLLNPAAIVRTIGTSPVLGGATPTYGAVEFLAQFLAMPGTTGRLTIQATRSTFAVAGSTVVNSAAIDVDANGTVELTSPGGPLTTQVTIGPSGRLLVKLTIANHAVTNGFLYSSSRTEAVLTLDPPTTCTLTAYGSGCGGAMSSATQLPTGMSHALALACTGAFANAPVVSAFGAQNSGPTLPGGCVLATDATILLPLVADGLGAASQFVALPTTAVGTLYHQFVPIDLATFSFRASNGLEIRCQ